MAGYRGGTFWSTKCFLPRTSYKPENGYSYLNLLLLKGNFPNLFIIPSSSQHTHLLEFGRQRPCSVGLCIFNSRYCAWYIQMINTAVEFKILIVFHDPNVRKANLFPKFIFQEGQSPINAYMFLKWILVVTCYFAHQLSSKSLLSPNATSPSYLLIYFSWLLAPLLRMTLLH